MKEHMPVNTWLDKHITLFHYVKIKTCLREWIVTAWLRRDLAVTCWLGLSVFPSLYAAPEESSFLSVFKKVCVSILFNIQLTFVGSEGSVAKIDMNENRRSSVLKQKIGFTQNVYHLSFFSHRWLTEDPGRKIWVNYQSGKIILLEWLESTCKAF